MPQLTIEGQRAYYVHRESIQPKRPAVVFIHGAGGSHRHWLYQVRDLPHTSTYAVDLPGHGKSQGPGRTSVPAYADWLFAFLSAVGLEKALLVGHSMGGAIAQDVALRFPDHVAGLGLVGTGARLRVLPALLHLLGDGAGESFEAAVRLVSSLAFSPDAPPEMVRLANRQMGETPPEVLYGDFAACDAFDVMRRLGEISSPTAVLCGTQDQLTPMKYSTYLRDNIRGATLHLVEGAGHMVMIEQPQAVIEALSALLDSL